MKPTTAALLADLATLIALFGMLACVALAVVFTAPPPASPKPSPVQATWDASAPMSTEGAD